VFSIAGQLNARRNVLFLLVLLVAVGPISTVLCYCQNGEVTIESAFHRCCSTGSSDQGEARPSGTMPNSDSESDDPCQDVPFSISAKLNSHDKPHDSQLIQPEICILDSAVIAQADSLSGASAITPAVLPRFFTPMDFVILQL